MSSRKYQVRWKKGEKSFTGGFPKKEKVALRGMMAKHSGLIDTLLQYHAIKAELGIIAKAPKKLGKVVPIHDNEASRDLCRGLEARVLTALENGDAEFFEALVESLKFIEDGITPDPLALAILRLQKVGKMPSPSSVPAIEKALLEHAGIEVETKTLRDAVKRMGIDVEKLRPGRKKK
jgi:hypothetical protein